MFFQNGLVTPALGAIEFRDNTGAVVQANLIDPVFIAVQRGNSSIRVPSGSVNRIQNLMWVQLLES